MKTIIESLLELTDISDNNNRIELYKGMAQKLREVTEKNQFHLMERFYSNLCGLMAHSDMGKTEYNKVNQLLECFHKILFK